MAHYGEPPIFAGVSTSNRFVWFLVHGWQSLVFGAPAVICFFVISGFCIHLPFRGGRNLPVGRYYARRYIRILIPVAAMIAIDRLTGGRDPILGRQSVLWTSVLWSLLCEEIYYAVYPAVRLLSKRFGWRAVTLVSFLAPAAILLSSRLDQHDLWVGMGPLRTTAALFPIWLAGCMLAEQAETLPAIESSVVIWCWRIMAWGATWVCRELAIHAHVPYMQMMPWFGIVAYFWIRKEIAYGKQHKASMLLAFGGTWSYSLYLLHVSAMRVFENLHIPDLGAMLNWCALVAFGLAVSYGFYLVIERPSHRLARMFQVQSGNRQGLPKMANETAALRTEAGGALGKS